MAGAEKAVARPCRARDVCGAGKRVRLGTANPAMPAMLNGFCRRLPEDRAEELFSTPFPFPSEVTYRVLAMRAHEIEQAVHRLLGAQPVAPGREFLRPARHRTLNLRSMT